MSTKEPKKKIKFIPYRPVGSKREYSNYVEVTKSMLDVSIKFCDVKPPENIEELQQVQKTGLLKIPIVTEVVLPLAIARAFLDALRTQMEKENK